MMELIIIENIAKKTHPNCNGEMLIIDGSNAMFGGDNNLLASLECCRLLEAISFINQVIFWKLLTCISYVAQ